MTRANFHLITEQGTFKFQAGSDAYPDNILNHIFKLVLGCASTNATLFYTPSSFELSEFISDCGLSLGSVGNFYYHYEINFVKKEIRVWDSKVYWVNAPNDWKERGWNCWVGDNGKYGYPNWRKGKELLKLTFNDIVTIDNRIKTINNDVLNKALKCAD